MDHRSFRDLGRGSGGHNPPDMVALVGAIKRSPIVGRAIRTFSSRHFENLPLVLDDSAALVYSKAVVQIPRAASQTESIDISDLPDSFQGELADTLCTSSTVKIFTFSAPTTHYTPGFADL